MLFVNFLSTPKGSITKAVSLGIMGTGFSQYSVPIWISEDCLYYLVHTLSFSQRAHKMSRKDGHYQKVRRPTNLEVYNDAAKILEELLERRMDGANPNRQKRNKTDPCHSRILDTLKEADNHVARSKTMPSKYRESPNISQDAVKKELNAKLKEDEKLLRQIELDMTGCASSADTEGENDDDMALKERKKKTFFKLAKERLIHVFNRDKKMGLDKAIARDMDKTSPSLSKRRKPKKKLSERDKLKQTLSKEDIVTEKNRHIKAHLNKDNSVDYTEEVEYRNKDGSFTTGTHLVRNSRTSSFSRSSLINIVKRPFAGKSGKHSKSE